MTAQDIKLWGDDVLHVHLVSFGRFIHIFSQMKACDLAGEWEQALALLNEMRGMGIPASELCFTAAIKSCANADEVMSRNDVQYCCTTSRCGTYAAKYTREASRQTNEFCHVRLTMTFGVNIKLGRW